MTEYLDKWDGDIVRALRFQDDQLCELAADEITRLRAALERIADTDPDEGTQWFHEVARAALQQEVK